MIIDEILCLGVCKGVVDEVVEVLIFDKICQRWSQTCVSIFRFSLKFNYSLYWFFGRSVGCGVDISVGY